MNNFALKDGEKLPFLRQIQDYHKYSALGSTWMISRLDFRNLNLDKFEKVYFELINEQSILRTIFVRNSEGLILRNTISASYFDIKIFNVNNITEIDHFFDSFHTDYRYSELSAPLLKVFIFNLSNISYVFLCINHIICDRHCLDKISDSLIRKYINPEYVLGFYDFDEYCRTRNSSLLKKFNNDYSFFEQKFNHGVENNIDSTNEYLWIKNICNLEYNYYLKKKKPLTTDSLIRLDIQKLNHINIKSLVICSLLKTQRNFLGENNHVGFLFRDSVHPNFNNCIGELTAESSVSCNPENINYLTINKELFNAYRRPIFNYPMYNLNELYLEENTIPVFLNFSKTKVEYTETTYLFNPSFYEAAVLKGDIEPNIILYGNGYLLCRWLFDENKIGKEDMIKFKNMFEDNIRNESILLYNN
ncbi:hypothetical protein [Chryseobacterium indologenes]|uniref:hypothetical protein n=1 Tax=Chryseobacterium indologenes TaxID=253 RepID=UPI001BCE8E8A|nr:hypothetical protein [Chryseobacterium indologenes]